MTHVVCQVIHRADRVTFIWSEGAASFAPYHLSGAERARFADIAAQARATLAQAGSTANAELARLGHQLYRAMFCLDVPMSDEARAVEGWLREQMSAGQLDTLEFLTDAAGTVPWNLLRETADDGAAEPGRERFWGCRFNLAGGRRTNPLRLAPPLVEPTALLAADIALLETLGPDVRSRVEAWGAQRLLMDSPEQLASHLRSRTPDILILLARVEGEGLRIGTQAVTPAQLRQWIGEASEGNPDPIVFLGAAGTPEQADTWLRWLAAATEGLVGLITNEVPLNPDDATRAALECAQRFLQGRRPLAATLVDARVGLDAAGLAFTAFCPPTLTVAAHSDTESPSGMPVQPLPDYPYCPLRPYGPEHRPLFFGREDDTLRLASLLDAGATTGVILHGSAAVGKTSLVRAGLLPFLEQECVGYRVLCDRTPDETPTAEADYPPLLLRAGNDLAGQLADGLVAFCAQPLTYATPAGTTVTVDLPTILASHIGRAAVASTAITPPRAAMATPAPAVDEAGIAVPETGAPEPEPEAVLGPAEVWLALREDPALFGRILDAVTRPLPYELLIVVDQAEELVTLTESATERERRQRVLVMLVALADSAARCKVLLVLRTSYYGQLVDLLPAGREPSRWKTFFLEPLSHTALVDAVRGPTSRDEVLYSDEIPFQKYGFAFEEALAQQIVDEVSQEARAARPGAAPLLQAVCAMLYERSLRAHGERVIRAADLKAIGGVRGAVTRYVGQAITRLPLPSGARDGLRRLIPSLYTRGPDGDITRTLVVARDLKSAWKGPVPIEQAVNAAADQAGLLVLEPMLVAGENRLFVSLADDAVAEASRGWATDPLAARGTRKAGVIDTLWIMIPLAMLAAALTYFLTNRINGMQYGELETAAIKLAKENEQLKDSVEEQVQVGRVPRYRAQLALAEQAAAAGNALQARQVLLREPAATATPRNDLRGFDWDHLWRRVNGARASLHGHLGTVHALAVASEGKLAASAAADGTVRLWRLDGDRAAAVLFVGKTPLYAVALSPDGKTVAAAGADKMVHVWDIGDLPGEFATISQEPRTLAGHDAEVHALAFAKDGRTLASGGADKTVILWEVATGKTRITLKDHDTPVAALAFSPDGKSLASAGAAPNVILHAAETGKQEQTLKTRFHAIGTLAFAPDSKTIAVGGTERHAGIDIGAVQLWDPAKGTEAKTAAPIFHGRGVHAVAYRPDGKAIASAGKDNIVRLWDVASGDELGRWVGHLGWVNSIAFDPDGTALVSAGYDRAVMTWDGRGDRATQVLRGHKDWVQALAFGAGAEKQPALLASGGKDGAVKLWDAATGAPAGELPGHTGAVTSVAFAFHRPMLLAVGTWGEKGDGEIKLWELTRTEKGTGYRGKELQTLRGHKRGITCLAFSPTEAQLASGSADATAILWDVKTGKAITDVDCQSVVGCLAFTPDGKGLAIGSGKEVRVMDIASTQLITPPFTAHTDTVAGITFVRRDTGSALIGGLVTGGLDGLIRFWTLSEKGFVPVTTARAPGQPITSLQRGSVDALFTGGWDGTVRSWEIDVRFRRDGEKVKPLVDLHERFSFTGATGPIRAVAMAPDASVLAAAGHDGTIQLWRAARTRPYALPKADPAMKR